MRKINSINEIQKIELDILDFVVDICEKFDIRYFLAGGTLLGAIRHKGFIPWDNDIDISMPREDYDRFIKIMEKDYLDSNYRLLRVKNDNDYVYPYIKIVDNRTTVIELGSDIIKDLGVYIDIFPLDSYGNNYKEAVKNLEYIRKKSITICYSMTPGIRKSLRTKVTRAIRKIEYTLLGREESLKRVHRKIKKYTFENSKYIASTYGLRGIKELIESENFSDYEKVSFERKLYRAPIGYDAYLKRMYGDYLQLPPLEERIAPHQVEVFLKEGNEN